MENWVPTYSTRIVRLDPTLAELRIDFPGLPASLEVRGRLMGPRCPGVSTVEVAYPLNTVQPGHYRVLIPEPSLWSAERPHVYTGPVEFWRQGERQATITISVGLRQGGMVQEGS